MKSLRNISPCVTHWGCNAKFPILDDWLGNIKLGPLQAYLQDIQHLQTHVDMSLVSVRELQFTRKGRMTVIFYRVQSDLLVIFRKAEPAHTSFKVSFSLLQVCRNYRQANQQQQTKLHDQLRKKYLKEKV